MYADYGYSPKISVPLNWGAEGVIYEKGDDGILHFRLDKDNNIILTPPYQSFDEMRNNTTPSGSPLAVFDEYYGKICDYTWDAVDLLQGQIANGKNEIMKEYTAVPMMIFTPEEQTRISQIQTTISDIVRRYTIQWVLDGDADKTWDTYLSELKAAGVDDLVKTYQGAYDRFLSAKK